MSSLSCLRLPLLLCLGLLSLSFVAANDASFPSSNFIPAPSHPTLLPGMMLETLSTTPYQCKVLAFVLSGRWLPWSSQQQYNKFVVLNQQPVVMSHRITLVFGMDPQGADNNDVVMATDEFTFTSMAAKSYGNLRGRMMLKTNAADAPMMNALPAGFVPFRFDTAVPWSVDTKQFQFRFRHLECGDFRVVYKYNPKVAYAPIIPANVGISNGGSVGGSVTSNSTLPTTAPAAPITNPELCKITEFKPSTAWTCTQPFDASVMSYTCTIPETTMYDTLTVAAPTLFLGVRASVNSDFTTAMIPSKESASLRFLPGRNILVINTFYGPVCNLAYTFDVTRAEAATPPAEPLVNWYSGEWTACTGSCDTAAAGMAGTQTRVVQCRNEQEQAVPDEKCTGPKPATEQTCEAVCDAPVFPEPQAPAEDTLPSGTQAPTDDTLPAGETTPGGETALEETPTGETPTTTTTPATPTGTGTFTAPPMPEDEAQPIVTQQASGQSNSAQGRYASTLTVAIVTLVAICAAVYIQ